MRRPLSLLALAALALAPAPANADHDTMCSRAHGTSGPLRCHIEFDAAEDVVGHRFGSDVEGVLVGAMWSESGWLVDLHCRRTLAGSSCSTGSVGRTPKRGERIVIDVTTSSPTGSYVFGPTYEHPE